MKKILILIFILISNSSYAIVPAPPPATNNNNYTEPQTKSSAFCEIPQYLLVFKSKEVGEGYIANVNSVCLDEKRKSRISKCDIEISIEDFVKEYCGAKTLTGIQLKNDYLIIFYK